MPSERPKSPIGTAQQAAQRLTAAGPVGWGQLSRPTAVAGATGRRGPSMARGLRQEDLVHDMKVSRQTINAIETGRYLPSLPLAIALARYFGKRVEVCSRRPIVLHGRAARAGASHIAPRAYHPGHQQPGSRVAVFPAWVHRVDWCGRQIQ